MGRAVAYRLWQAPFAERKLEPFFRHNDLGAVRRVLDVGCGPGTNARHFGEKDYLGVDLNPDYVAWARRRYGDRFTVADVTRTEAVLGPPSDCILVNSLLHHVDDDGARNILRHLSSRLTVGGHVHILDLVLPEHASLALLLARWDRGDHPRPLEAWRSMFFEAFEPVVFEPYPLGIGALPLWQMVYFKGRRRS